MQEVKGIVVITDQQTGKSISFPKEVLNRALGTYLIDDLDRPLSEMVDQRREANTVVLAIANIARTNG